MKALDILNKINNNKTHLQLELFEYGIDIRDINKAIAELEELESRSCGSCGAEDGLHCSECIYNKRHTDYWEKKDDN